MKTVTQRRRDGAKAGPNEHGVLPVTEEVVVPGMPKGCSAVIRLSLHEGLWYYGYELGGTSPHFMAASALPKIDTAKWTARWACLDAGLRQAIRWFQDQRHDEAVRVLTEFARGRSDAPWNTLNSALRIPQSAISETPFPGARAPRSPSKLKKPSGFTMPKTTASATTPTEPWIPFDERPVEHVDPRKLTIHAYVEIDPYIDKKNPRLIAKRRQWTLRGTCEPLLVSPKGVVSGRHRLRHSLEHEWKIIPIRRIGEDEVVEAADKDFLAHHRMSASVRNYLGAPKLEHHFRAAQERHIAILQSGGKKVPPPVASLEALAKELDLSPEYLRIARSLHGAFANPAKFVINGKKTTLKEHFEPRLLCDDGEDKDGTKLPLSLGDAWKGVSYFLKSGAGEAGNPTPQVRPARNTFLHNFTTAGRNLAKAAKGWERWTDNERELVVDTFAESFVQLPGAALDGLAIALKTAKRQQAKAAAEAAETTPAA